MYTALRCHHGVNYLSALQSFEPHYLAAREKEGWLYADGLVQQLPIVPPDHQHRDIWRQRQLTLERLIRYLRRHGISGPILDLGCGNGWFSHRLVQATGATVVALDLNARELEQLARCFPAAQLHACYGDIFEPIFAPATFSLITMNGSAQYFPDFPALLRQLLSYLKPDGAIHIMDTPFYTSDAVAAARARTASYYQDLGVPAMVPYYHHRSWEDLAGVAATTLYRVPAPLWTKIRRAFGQTVGAFPWIRIVHP